LIKGTEKLRKFLGKLTDILLILNPFCGFLIVTSVFYGYWYLVIPLSIFAYYNMKLYFYLHRNDPTNEQIERDKKLNRLL